MTGGNYWMPDAIQYLDSQGKLILGGGLTATQVAALNDGKARVLKQLSEAATLVVTGNTLKITNLTGHKIISGYPEGRRMWLNIKWYDGEGIVLREDGSYGQIEVLIDGVPTQVETILDLHDTNTKIYEAHYGMTKEWAAQLISLGYSATIPLSFDRVTGLVDYTLGDLAQPTETTHETFHFVLNNVVVKDNRIPPYGMTYEKARVRNALPVPADQYGNPGAGGTYNYWDELTLNPPAGASYATIDLLYQPTSWEYIQFLYLANKRQNTFLANEGVNLLDAWLNNGMAKPYVMASTIWGSEPVPPPQQVKDLKVDSLTTWSIGRKDALGAQTDTFRAGDTVAIIAHVTDSETSTSLSGAQVFVEIRNSGGAVVNSLQGFSDENGDALMKWKTSKRQAKGTYSANITDVVKNGYQLDSGSSVLDATVTIQ